MKTLNKTVLEADGIELDACWAVLRDTRLGIKRKLSCWALILDIDDDVVLNEADQDGNGRILDKICRHSFHNSLITRSKQLNEQQKQ